MCTNCHRWSFDQVCWLWILLTSTHLGEPGSHSMFNGWTCNKVGEAWTSAWSSKWACSQNLSTGFTIHRMRYCCCRDSMQIWAPFSWYLWSNGNYSEPANSLSCQYVTWGPAVLIPLSIWMGGTVAIVIGGISSSLECQSRDWSKGHWRVHVTDTAHCG